MIKRLIFDLDNTIIMWDDDFYISLDQTFECFGLELNLEIKNNLIKAIIDYDSIYDIFAYDNMKNLMEVYSNIKLPDGLVEKWTECLENAVPLEKDLELINTLEYLNKKYELVVLTNWFTKQQIKRLENYGVLKYFKEVIGTDLVSNKPSKAAFLKACGEYDINECIMIGDSLEKDVKGALNAGIRAILYDYSNNYTGVIENIKNMSELKNIL